MVDDISPSLSRESIRNINKAFISWFRFMPDKVIADQKSLVYEDAKERLHKQGVDIESLNLEWVEIYHPAGGPIDQSILLGLKEVVINGR